MKVSLVLATVGRSIEVGRCLRSLSTQTDSNFEVLLVDQNQDDRLLPFVQDALENGMALTHLRMAVPSLSGARNLGISNSNGQIIGLTDDDCWYETDTIANVRQACFEDDHIDGIVACWVEQTQARSGPPSVGALSSESWRCFRGGDASSISLFFRRTLFDRLGRFDDRFGIGQWYGAAEETDFVLRALASGALLKHCPNARVHHSFGAVSQSTLLTGCNQIRKRARGTGGIYAKHRLNAWVIFRGLTAPVLKPLVRGRFGETLRGAFTVLGRLEGYLRWRVSQQ